MKKKLYIAILLLLLSVQAPLVLAAEISPATTSVKESVNELLTVRDDDTLTAEEKIEKELDARKNVVGEVLSLSITEVTNLEKDLKSLTFTKGSREESMRDAFIVALASYKTYFNQEKSTLEDVISIDEAKALAQEIKTYRDEIYNKQTQIIVEFVLLFRNEQALATTQSRYDKIVADVAKLEKKGYISNGKFVEPLKQVETLIKDAKTMTAQARTIILATDEEKSATAKAAAKKATESEIVKDAPTSRALLVKSFENVKDSYVLFIQISKDVRGMLGI
jgi:Holliday junction resolvase